MSIPAVLTMISGAASPTISNTFVNNKSENLTLQITGTYSSATVLVQGLVDVNSTSWVTLATFNLTDLSLTTGSGIGGNGLYQVAIGGILRVRLNVTAISGGEITITANFVGETISVAVENAEPPNLIPVTAYDMAVDGGYTGTKEQFETDMGNSATNATNAAASAETATTAAMNAAAAAVNFAPVYSASSTYAVGDYVLKDGVLYRCNTAITTAEAWTAAHWTQAKLGPDVADVKNALSGAVGIVTAWSDGFWTNNNEFNSDHLYLHSDYIPINDIAYPIHYNIKTVSTVPKYILFDENKGFIKKYMSDSSSLITIDDVVDDLEGASYIVFETYFEYPATLEYCDLSNSVVRGFLKTVTPNDITNNSIPQSKLSFAELKMPVNLFDYTNPDYCIRSTWYYSTTVGSTVAPVSNSNTTPYLAIKIPLYPGIEKVTFGIYPNVLTRKVFWIGAVDADMKLLTYETVNSVPPITYTIPSGAAYLLVSYSLDSANFDAYIPTIMAVSGEEITGYYPYFDPYYLLQNCRTESIDPQKTIKLMLPDIYDAVVGDVIQIFYKGIVNAIKPELFDVSVQCASGGAYKRYFEMTPQSVGNVNAIFYLYDSEHTLLDTKSVTFAVHDAPVSPGAQKNILCVGDSLTTGGTWPIELHRRLVGSGGTPAGDNLSNINFIGTRVASDVHYEGYGGWTFNSYNTANINTNTKIITCTSDKTEAQDQHSIYKDANNDTWKLETIEQNSIKIIAVSSEGRNFPSSGTLTWVSGGVNHSNIVYSASQNAPGNPFWNTETNEVDFAAYANNLGVWSIDYVLVLLGWNSAALSEADYKDQAQTFITNVHTSYPNAKIILMGLEIPAYDGIAANYGATGTYGSFYGLMNYVFSVDNRYADLVEDNTNTYAVNLSGQFDTEYNMPTGTRQVNSRNAETVTYQSNGVHPATTGYYQIADAFYRKLVALL